MAGARQPSLVGPHEAQARRRYLPGRRDKAFPLLVIGAVTLYMAFAQLVLGLPVLVVVGGLFLATAVTFMLLQPLWGFYLFVAILSGEMLLGISGALTTTKVLGFTLLGTWVVEWMFHRTYRFPRSLMWWLFAQFLTIALISLALKAENLTRGVERIGTHVQLFVLVVIVSTILRRPKDLEALALVFMLSMTLSSLYGVVQWFRGGQSLLSGLSTDRNVMGILVAINVPFVFYFFPRVSGLKRFGLVLTLWVFAVAEGLSLSRTGFLAMCTSLGLSVLLMGRVGRKPMIVLLLVSVLCVAIFLPDSFWQRMGGIGSSVSGATDTVGLRFQLWQVALRMIRDHPFLGVGPGNYFHQFMRYGGIIGLRRDPLVSHQAYLGISAEMCIGAGLTFAAIILTALFHYARAARRAGAAGEQDLRDLAICFGISLLVYGLVINTISQEYMKALWMLIGTSLAVGVMAADVASGEQEQPRD